MVHIGLDIGSTAAKAAVMDEDKTQILWTKTVPTGWDSKATAAAVREEIQRDGYDVDTASWTATGYGRVSVEFANKVVTEITCHAKGSGFLCGQDLTVIDIGGQDTKIITIQNGQVMDFMMNDKCSAGTGRFLEIMAATLGCSLPEMFTLAEQGKEVKISSMCTVFAESEVISLIGKGTAKTDIARGVIGSIVNKVYTQTMKHRVPGTKYFLSGGFSVSPYMVKALSEKLEAPVETHEYARYAGAIGAALLGKKPA